MPCDSADWTGLQTSKHDTTNTKKESSVDVNKRRNSRIDFKDINIPLATQLPEFEVIAIIISIIVKMYDNALAPTANSEPLCVVVSRRVVNTILQTFKFKVLLYFLTALTG